MIRRLIVRVTLVLWVCGTAGPGAQADEARDIDRLIDLLGFAETVGIMRDEGLRYGGRVAEDLMPGADTQTWQKTVAQIYDADKMLTLISADFRTEMAGTDLAPLLAFFATPEGRRVIELELEARRAFLDQDTEDLAIEAYNASRDDGGVLQDQIDQIIKDSDLVEFNVMGALNSSMMFYRGMRDGGALDLTEDELMADVWEQEDEARAFSAEWLGAYLTTAYGPLPPEQVEDYAALYRSPEGRVLNRALFAAFDQMYLELSYLLGLAVADHMSGETL